jgi:hypothetical protein
MDEHAGGSGRTRLLEDLAGHVWRQKLWWMVPMLAAVVLLGLLLVLAQDAAVAPFVYTLD